MLGEKLFQSSRRLRGERDERLRVARRELFGKVRYCEPTFGKRWERTCGFSDKESSGERIFREAILGTLSTGDWNTGRCCCVIMFEVVVWRYVSSERRALEPGLFPWVVVIV